MADAMPDTDTNFVMPQIYLRNSAAAHFTQLVDWDAASYLATRLQGLIPDRVVPLKTSGDGNCLVHAVSKAIWGLEGYEQLLRSKLQKELTENLEWYKGTTTEIEDKDWERAVGDVPTSGKYLEFIHIFALSNLLKRPILIYASLEDTERYGEGESGVSATFVPYRFPPEEIQGRPIVVAWSSTHKNHYVPLVELEGRAAPTWPQVKVAFSKALPAPEASLAYLKFAAAVRMAPLVDLLNQEEAAGEKKSEAKLMDELARKMAANVSTGSKMDVLLKLMEVHRAVTALETLSMFATLAEGFEAAQARKQPRKAPAGMIEELSSEGLSLTPPKKLSPPTEFAWDVTSGGVMRKLHYNITEDPVEAARRFLLENNQSLEKLEKVVSFILTNARAAGASPPSPSFPAKSPLAPPVVPPPTSPPTTPAPQPTYAFLPFKGPFIVYDKLVLDGVRRKILELNDKLSADESSKQLALAPADVALLQKLTDTLANTSTYTTSAIDHELPVITRLSKWPKHVLFPVLDLVRMTIIHPQGAAYFSKGPVVMSVLMSYLDLPPEDHVLQLLSLKILANMFHHPPLRQLVIKYAAPLLQKLSSVPNSPNKAVRLALSHVMCNYAALLPEFADMNIHLSFLMVTLESLHDPALRERALQSEMRQQVQKHIDSSVPKVRDVAQDLLKVVFGR